jgi:hypothetical protein
MKNFRRWIIALLILLALSGAGFVVWGSTPLGPMPEARTALQSDAQVNVKDIGWLVFSPVGQTVRSGLIFYPGGRVDYRSYAPEARAIAEKGFLVVIVPMPFNLAVFGTEKASEVMAAFPEIKNWAVGGHSLGGAMAAHYIYQHPDRVKGLVFWAAYPAQSDSLANLDISVASIYATQDGLATGKKIKASRTLLPEQTRWVAIQGGNHEQFGWYGHQDGDHAAQIDRAEQQRQTVEATVALLSALDR